MARTVFFISSRSYLTGRLRSRSKSKVESCTPHRGHAASRQRSASREGALCCSGRTTVISLPAALRKALVHRSLRGLYLFLNVLWHFDLQNRKTCRAARTRPVGVSWAQWQRGAGVHLCVVAHEGDAVARIARAGAAIARLNPHAPLVRSGRLEAAEQVPERGRPHLTTFIFTGFFFSERVFVRQNTTPEN
jgi:hypothetical protein